MTDQPLLGLRALVVEDEMILLIMIEGMLRDAGCDSISSAATVKHALVLIDAQTFDIAMLDLNLNGDQSYPIADMLASCCVPFLFATGYGRQGVIDGYRDRPVLRKPYRFEELVSALQSLIDPDRLLPSAA